jgi:L-ascorbate 6-phosphate lactonase
MLMQEILDTELADRQVAIFWLGQNSFIFKTCSDNLIALDLYLSRIPSREPHIHPAPPMKPEEVKVDYVFCTHNHWDHTDPDTLPTVAKTSPKTIFLGSEESCDHFLKMGIDQTRAHRLEPGVSKSFDDFKVTTFLSIPQREGTTTHFGYLFDFDGLKIYNMGDSSLDVALNPEPILNPVAEAHPDIAIFPIIGDYKERRPEDAFAFTKIVKPKFVIPCHYDCFENRTINPSKFTDLFVGTPKIKPIVIRYAGKYVHSW